MTVRNSIFDRLDNSSARHSISRLADDAPVPYADSWPSRKPPKIRTSHAYPPIPIRIMDWQAVYDDDEPNADGQMAVGHGRTEAEAIRDLIDNHPSGASRPRPSIKPLCKYGDPLCPCPDGDPCHYEGKNPMRPPAAYEAACAAIEAQAARTARAIIKMRARDYALRPRELDALGDDLRSLPPKHLVTALAYIARNPTPYRHVGFGGEIPAVNLRGASLYARYSRAKANQLSHRMVSNVDR